MKRIGLILLLIVLLTGCSNEYNNLVYSREGFFREGRGVLLDDNYYIVAQIIEDVTGDKIEDEIYLIGYQEDEEREDVIGSNYYSNLYLTVIDGANKSSQITSLKYTKGLSPSLMTEDFNSDDVKDIYISMYTIPSGGAPRGLFNIISYYDNKAMTLFGDEDISEGLKFTLSLRDEYLVEISSEVTNITTSFKLEKSICEWLEEEKIYKDGKVIQQANMTIDGFNDLELRDTNNDGTYELVGTQYLAIISRTAGLGFIETTLKYDSNQSKWIVIGLEFKPF